MRLLTPAERRTQQGLRQREDLARFGESLQRRFAEQQPVVDGHFEPPFGAAAQRHLNQDRGPGPQNLRRQTDGLLEIVSRDAELDRGSVPGINHGQAAL